MAGWYTWFLQVALIPDFAVCIGVSIPDGITNYSSLLLQTNMALHGYKMHHYYQV